MLITLIVVLWGVQELIPPGAYQTELKALISFGGTVLALAVVSIIIFTWRGEWRGTSDLHRELANTASQLSERYREIYQADVLDDAKLRRADSDRQEFEREQNGPLGLMPDWCVPEGFQHVGQRFPDQNIRCNSCQRHWNDLRKLSWWRWRIFFGKCKNCGFVK